MNEYRSQQLRAADLYRYHGIAYTYADLITAHQKQQQTAWKHIECGDYEAAHSITSTDPREFLPQIAEQQTGDKRTLTAPTKCGIIKAIARHVRRWKQKQEGKAMKNATDALNDTIRAQIASAEKELEKAMKNLDYEKAGEIEKEIESLKIQLETPIPERKICF